MFTVNFSQLIAVLCNFSSFLIFSRCSFFAKKTEMSFFFVITEISDMKINIARGTTVVPIGGGANCFRSIAWHLVDWKEDECWHLLVALNLPQAIDV